MASLEGWGLHLPKQPLTCDDIQSRDCRAKFRAKYPPAARPGSYRSATFGVPRSGGRAWGCGLGVQGVSVPTGRARGRELFGFLDRTYIHLGLPGVRYPPACRLHRSAMPDSGCPQVSQVCDTCDTGIGEYLPRMARVSRESLTARAR